MNSRQKNKTTSHTTPIALPVIVAALLNSACTEQLPGSIRFLQQQETFGTEQDVDTKIDMLWVVDNSASMDVVQKKIRQGIESFALKYMRPTWDIQVAAITTDTYLAHSAFNTYLSSTISGTIGYNDSYISTRYNQAPFVNPASNPNLVNLSTGIYDNGIKINDLVPVWGSSYARLLPGYHDGPITGHCFTGMPHFYGGLSQCTTRDAPAANVGVDSCIDPGPGEDSLEECVNTIQNDTVRSGRAIIKTQPDAGVSANAAWTDQLVRDFKVNLSTGSSGHGSERGLGSFLQLLEDNESSETPLFRSDSLRVIVFVADEDDQTMEIPETPPADYTALTDYKCDQASLIALNPGGNITGVNGLCCDTPGNNCRYGAAGTSCPQKNVNGLTYRVGFCPDETKLVPVTSIKNTIDNFFNDLDGGSDPNYFTVAIVPLSADSINTLQSERDTVDQSLGTTRAHYVDRGDRYIELGDLVGNGSMALEISQSDYTPILEAIGQTIIQKKGTFQLNFPPTSKDEIIFKILHQDGGETNVPHESYDIQENSLVITDLDFIINLESTDRVYIDYQPSARQ